MDVWVAVSPENAERIVRALGDFGFGSSYLLPDLFLTPNRIIRMGVPPMRLEIATSISGVDFATCYAARVQDKIDGVPVNLISLEQLKVNKRASGRYKDLNDLENLP